MGLPPEVVQQQWTEVYHRPWDEWDRTPEDSLYWQLMVPTLQAEARQAARDRAARYGLSPYTPPPGTQTITFGE